MARQGLYFAGRLAADALNAHAKIQQSYAELWDAIQQGRPLSELGGSYLTTFKLTPELKRVISGHYVHPPAGINIAPHIREMLDQQTRQMHVPVGPPAPAITYDDMIAFYRSLSRGFVPGVLQDSIPLAEQLRRAASRAAQEPPGDPVLVVNATTADAIAQAGLAGRPVISPNIEVLVANPPPRRRWWHRFTRRQR
jgi:hypothetical protein